MHWLFRSVHVPSASLPGRQPVRRSEPVKPAHSKTASEFVTDCNPPMFKVAEGGQFSASLHSVGSTEVCLRKTHLLQFATNLNRERDLLEFPLVSLTGIIIPNRCARTFPEFPGRILQIAQFEAAVLQPMATCFAVASPLRDCLTPTVPIRDGMTVSRIGGRIKSLLRDTCLRIRLASHVTSPGDGTVSCEENADRF